MIPGVKTTVLAMIAVAALTVAGVLAAATAGGTADGESLQRQRGFRGQREAPVEVGPGSVLVPYDGRFTFARLRYDDGLTAGSFFGRRRRGGGAPWSHDYPRAERHLAKILAELTSIEPYDGEQGGSIVAIGDPELFKYPLSYMSEPGYWTMSDAEALNLRNYLLKGGFIIFDDFRGYDWNNFETQLRRVLPDARFVNLEVTHPIFQSFFAVESLNFQQYYDQGTPEFVGVFEDNDPSKRLMLIANYNNDVGEYWEWSDTGYVPIDLSNEAYKLGVDYIVYGITH
jgi:hypothetical protein